MMRRLILVLEHVTQSYRTKQLQSAIRSKKERQGRTKLIKEYGQQYACITLQEARWIFQHEERWGTYYIFYLLMASTGIRACELVHLSLHSFNKEYTCFTYPVAKRRRYYREEEDLLEEREKERTVFLDPWVRDELLVYLKQRYSAIGPDGEMLFVSPYSVVDADGVLITNLLFPFKHKNNPHAYWWKLRCLMRKEGFDVDRLEKLTTNNLKGSARNTFVVRQHMWRGFACTIRYYTYGRDMKDVQAWINHSKMETTARYCKSAEQLGSTMAELSRMTWAQVTGYFLPEEVLL